MSNEKVIWLVNYTILCILGNLIFFFVITNILIDCKFPFATKKFFGNLAAIFLSLNIFFIILVQTIATNLQIKNFLAICVSDNYDIWSDQVCYPDGYYFIFYFPHSDPISRQTNIFIY